jgi:RES domain-containing protein
MIAALPLTPVEGTFYRIVFARDLDHLLWGAKTPEGRFHRDGQPALYMSPTPGAAAVAVDTYRQPDDPPRLIACLGVNAARIADLRDRDACAHLGLGGHEPSALWQPERQTGRPAGKPATRPAKPVPTA